MPANHYNHTDAFDAIKIGQRGHNIRGERVHMLSYGYSGTLLIRQEVAGARGAVRPQARAANKGKLKPFSPISCKLSTSDESTYLVF